MTLIEAKGEHIEVELCCTITSHDQARVVEALELMADKYPEYVFGKPYKEQIACIRIAGKSISHVWTGRGFYRFVMVKGGES